MISLDELISNITNSIFEADLELLQNEDSWTEETRDERVAKMEEIGMAAVAKAKKLIASMIEDDDDSFGVYLSKGIYFNVAQKLIDLRGTLDVTPDDKMDQIPVTYDWLTEKIRGYSDKITKVDIFLASKLATTDALEVETL